MNELLDAFLACGAAVLSVGLVWALVLPAASWLAWRDA